MYDYFIDKSRKEYSTPDTTDFCEISAQICYPAEVTGDIMPIKYWENASEKSAIITKFWDELPSFLFNYFSLIETHSYLNANIAKAKQKYPVLIFNHGSVGVPSLHTALMQELVSQGYIIFSIGHADYIPFFVKPDGQIKAFDLHNEEYQSKMRENDDDEVREIANNLMSSNDLKEQESLLRQFLERNPQNQRSIRRWADDISFTVDELEKINNGSSMLAGKLDLDRLGVFGNSFGGAASIQVCITDNRFKAAVNIDCIQFGDFLDNVPTQPMMFMSSDQHKGKNDLFLEMKKNPLFLVLVKGTTHQNFSDMSLWGGILKKQMLGTIAGYRCQEIQNTYIRAFFDKYLKGEDLGLLDGLSSMYPEVEIQAKNISTIPTLAQEKTKDKSDFPVLTGPYLGQKPPGIAPVIFAPGIISTEKSAEYGGHFSPDGSEFFFTRYSPGEQGQLWMTRLENDNWTSPRAVSFLGGYHGVESCLSPDGNELFFVWYDPESEDFLHDIYVIERTGEKRGIPHQLAKTNLGSRRISPSVARSGNLYFSGDFDEPGQKDIYCSRLINGEYSTPQNLGLSVNSTYHEEHVFVSPDEKYLLFDSYRPSKCGKSGMYVSYRMKDGTWSKAQNFGPTVNSEHYDWYPIATPDGKYIIFSRTFPSMKIDLYWVDAKIIEELKPEELM